MSELNYVESVIYDSGTHTLRVIRRPRTESGYDEARDGVVHFPTQERVIPPYESDGEEYPDTDSETPDMSDHFRYPRDRSKPAFALDPLQRRYTARSTAIISSLIPEVLDNIFSYIHVERSWENYRPASEFHPPLFVNKHWRYCAEEWLYYRVSIDTYNRAEVFVRTLSTYPRLADMVRELRMALEQMSKAETLNHARAMLLCPKLRLIDISGWNSYVLSFLRRALIQQTSIRYLNLSKFAIGDQKCDTFCSDTEILAIVKSMPELRRIWACTDVWSYETYSKRIVRKKIEAMGVEYWGPEAIDSRSKRH